ncbi:hypothetical protein RBB50_003091 [Rhinocladiella similis]
MSVPKKTTFTGSCHCGYIKYTVALPINTTTTTSSSSSSETNFVVSRCNCTICLKQGYTSLRFAHEDFTLLSPESEAQLNDYKAGSMDVHKYFCGKCGIHVFSRGRFELDGHTHEFSSLNVLTLDQPQDGLDLSKAKVQYFDGRNDNWNAGPRVSPWPGQCV